MRSTGLYISKEKIKLIGNQLVSSYRQLGINSNVAQPHIATVCARDSKKRRLDLLLFKCINLLVVLEGYISDESIFGANFDGVAFVPDQPRIDLGDLRNGIV